MLEKRAIAEKVMEAATRRRDEHLQQRAQGGPLSPSRPSTAAEAYEGQVAGELVETVIEHALLDQRLNRATALKGAHESPEHALRRRDRVRRVLATQMGKSALRKAALDSQQDRAAANRERLAREKAERLKDHAAQVEERRLLARQPRKFRTKRPPQLSLTVPSTTPASPAEEVAPMNLSDAESPKNPDQVPQAQVRYYQTEQPSEHMSSPAPAEPTDASPEDAAARAIQGAWWRFLVRRDLSRSSRSLHRLLGASLPSAGFQELTDLLQQPKLIAKAMSLLTHAATSSYPSSSSVKPKVMPASRRKARSFLAAFLIATHRDACFGSDTEEGMSPPPPPTEIEDLTHASAAAVVAAFNELLAAARKAGGAVHGAPAGRYQVFNRAVVRAQHTIESEKLGNLEAGQTIQVVEVVVDGAGRIRALCAGNDSDELWLRGWVSVENGSGGVLLERCGGAPGALSLLAARLVAAFRCFEARFDAWRSNDNARLVEESIGMVVEMERLRVYWDGDGPDVSHERAELERGIAQIGGAEAQMMLADAVAEVQAEYVPRQLGQSQEASPVATSESPGRALFQPPPSPPNPSQGTATHDLLVRQLMEETDITEGDPEAQTFSATPESETAAASMDEMDNLRLAHELQMNPGQFNLPGLAGRGPQRSVINPLAGDPVDAVAHAELVSQIELQARRAFWGAISH